MLFENVPTDANGRITITYSDFASSTTNLTGAYNAMRIVAVIPQGNRI